MKRVDHSKGTDVDGFLQAFAKDRNEIWVTRSGDLQNIIDELIDRLAALREQIAREVYVTLQEWDLKCDCPRYPDGETWDGHCCLLFAVVDEITKSTDISDAITRGVTE